MCTLTVCQMLHLLIDSRLILCVQLNETNFKVLVVTRDSSVVLNQLHVDEQGIYRCSLQGQNGDAFYQITFHLTGKSCSYMHRPGKIVRYVKSEWKWRQLRVQVNLAQKNKINQYLSTLKKCYWMKHAVNCKTGQMSKFEVWGSPGAPKSYIAGPAVS